MKTGWCKDIYWLPCTAMGPGTGEFVPAFPDPCRMCREGWVVSKIVGGQVVAGPRSDTYARSYGCSRAAHGSPGLLRFAPSPLVAKI